MNPVISMSILAALALFAMLISSSQAYNVPCLHQEKHPPGCEDRIVRCGTTPSQGVVAVVGPAADTWCVNHRIYLNEVYIMQFYDRNTTCWEIKMAIGECWGTQPYNGGVYSCMGKCGPGCGSINCGAWARDCLRHDVCSWFFSSTDGSSDPNCGQAYDWGSDDYLSNRLCTGTSCNDAALCK